MDETGIERRDPRRCTATNRAGAPCGKFRCAVRPSAERTAAGLLKRRPRRNKWSNSLN